jgi:zinc protease
MRFYLALFTFLLFFITADASAEIQPKQIVMENGLTVLLIERHTLPIVSVVALVKAGSINDPADLAGVANLTASLLDEGTQKRTSVQISEEIDFIGGSISASASKDFTTAGLKVLKKDIEKGLDLFSDVLLHPRFDPKEVDRVRHLILGGIHSEEDDPMAVAGRSFERLVYGDHPYRNPVVGLAATVEKITPSDLALFYQTHYLPNNALLSIVGDVTEKEAIHWVEKYFSEWKPKPDLAATIKTPAPPTLQPKQTDLIDKTLTQSSVEMGHVGIDRKNPDFYAVLVMNYILGGGGFSSRLLTEIRDNQGLVYSVSSSFGAQKQPGSFSISLQTKTANTNKAIAAALTEINRIRTEKVTEDEISEAKAYLIGSFPLRLETTDSLASILSHVGFYDLGMTYFKDYPSQIEKVSREDVLRAANQYLHPEQLSIVVVGNLAEARVTEPTAP